MNDILAGTFAEAIDAVAQRAADRRAGMPVQKQAAFDNPLTAIGNYLTANPAAMHAAIGAGVGGLAGGAASAFGNMRKDPEDRRSVLGSALTGALAGGAIGGGGSLALQKLKELGAPAGPGGRGVDIAHRGQNLHLTPQALTTPVGQGGETLPEVLRNQPSSSLPARALSAAVTAPIAGLANATPVAAAYLPARAAYDLARSGRASSSVADLVAGLRTGIKDKVPNFTAQEEGIGRLLNNPEELERLARDPLRPWTRTPGDAPSRAQPGVVDGSVLRPQRLYERALPDRQGFLGSLLGSLQKKVVGNNYVPERLQGLPERLRNMLPQREDVPLPALRQNIQTPVETKFEQTRPNPGGPDYGTTRTTWTEQEMRHKPVTVSRETIRQARGLGRPGLLGRLGRVAPWYVLPVAGEYLARNALQDVNRTSNIDALVEQLKQRGLARGTGS